MHCPNCGADNPSESHFCTNCGAPLQNPVDTGSLPESQPAPQQSAYPAQPAPVSQPAPEQAQQFTYSSQSTPQQQYQYGVPQQAQQSPYGEYGAQPQQPTYQQQSPYQQAQQPSYQQSQQQAPYQQQPQQQSPYQQQPSYPQSSQPYQSGYQPASEQQKKSPTTVIIVAVVIALVLILGFVLYMVLGRGGSEPSTPSSPSAGIELAERVTDTTNGYGYSFCPLPGMTEEDTDGRLYYDSDDPYMVAIAFAGENSDGDDAEGWADWFASDNDDYADFGLEVTQSDRDSFTLEGTQADNDGDLVYIRGLVNYDTVQLMVLYYKESDKDEMMPYVEAVADSFEAGTGTGND